MKAQLAFLFFIVGCYGADYSPEFARISAAYSNDAGVLPELDTTGSTCTEDALQALIQPPREAPDIFGHTRIVVDLPTGAKLRVCDTLEIDSVVRVRGNGARIFAHPSTGLVDLIHVASAARDTVIEDLTLLYWVGAPSLFDHDKTALRVEAGHFTLRDVIISGAGVGVDLDATAPGANVNAPHFDNVYVRSCRRAGVRVRGTDASGGYFAGLHVVNCENHFQSTNGAGPAIALEESSANGNVYVAPHLEVADVTLRVNPPGGMAPSTFVGAYIEEYNPANNGNRVEWLGNNSLRTTVVGGHLALLDEVMGDRVGALNSRLTFRQKTSSGDYLNAQIPAAEWGSVLRFNRSSGGASDTWLLLPQPAPSGNSQWGFEHYFNRTKPTVSFRAQHSWGTAEAILGGQPLCTAVAGCGP